MGRGCRILLAALASVMLGTQPAAAQRGLPGQLAVELAAGPADGFLMRDSRRAHRIWCGVALNRWNRGHSRWNFEAAWLQKDYIHEGVLGRERVPMAQFTAGAGFHLPLLYDRGRNVSLTGGLHMAAGYETSGWGDKRLRDGSAILSRDGFIWGPALSAEAEGYLSDRVMLFLLVRERCLFGSGTGTFHTLLGFGVRIVIR